MRQRTAHGLAARIERAAERRPRERPRRCPGSRARTCSASACSSISSPLREQPPSARSSRSSQPASADMASTTSRVCATPPSTLSACIFPLASAPARGGAATIATPVACAAVPTTRRAPLPPARRLRRSACARSCCIWGCRHRRHLPLASSIAHALLCSCLTHDVLMRVCVPCHCF